jgi:serine/threonine protein kinase
MTAQDDLHYPQDKTQLTAGGTPIAYEFVSGDIIGGDYEVLSIIGAGGMGNVYRVRHTIMQKEYALKTLSAEKVTEVAWRRFQNEAQAIARMNHPNVVAIYNLGFHDGHLPYYVMDLLHGTTLSDILREKGRLETTDALNMFIEVCAGIGYAHKKGIVHRDIKPPNIVLMDKPDPTGAKVKIVDFGIAKLSYTKDLASQQLTGMGEVCGSPYYMSPEQCQAGKIDARSDIYSLGCTLFEVLTGSPPFKGRNAMETMFLHGSATPPTLQAASGGIEYPHLLETAIAKTLAKAPMERYQNMEQLAQDLTAVLQESKAPSTNRSFIHSIRHDPMALMAAIVAILLIAAFGVCWFNSGRQKPITASIRGAAKAPISPGITQTPPDTRTAGAASAAPLMVASAVSTDGGSFSRIITKDGKQYLHFTFPRGKRLGKIWSFADNKRRDCEGEFDLPFHFVGIAPITICTEHPEYLRRFGPNILNTIEINGTLIDEEKFDRSLFKYLVGLKGLTSLTIQSVDDVDDNVMGYIEQIPDLIEFTCDDSNISMLRLSQSPLLNRLHKLGLRTQNESITPILQTLKNSPNLTVFELQSAKLTNEDYRLLATLPSLWNLDIDWTGTTEENLRALAGGVLHLRVFQDVDNYFTVDSIPVLKKVMEKKPSWIHIRSTHMTHEVFDRFKQAFPGAKVN